MTKLQTISLQKSWFTLESYSWTEIPSKHTFEKAGSSYIVHHWPSLFCRSNYEYLLIRFCSFCFDFFGLGFIFIHSSIPLLFQKGRALFGPIRFWAKVHHFICGDWAEPERLSCSARSQISIFQVESSQPFSVMADEKIVVRKLWQNFFPIFFAI